MIPTIVVELAEKEGKTPISWFVADDHVTIVYESGEKVRYELDQEQIPPASRKLLAEDPTAPGVQNLAVASEADSLPAQEEVTDRLCAWCGEPLPPDSRYNRLYHFECWKEVHNESIRRSAKKKYMLARIAKRFPHRTHSYPALGLDYVQKKLDGLINIDPSKEE